ncbi:efflux RND transporter periplasmic adaptor subunit [Gammaproteobacteria bacterium]|nr:efflux RND transporter periplasmic adaptor subunit [Gammaproteobacteria bacterium]
MQKKIILMFAVCSAIAILVLLIWYKNHSETTLLSQRSFPPAAVRVKMVISDVWDQKIFAAGTVAAEHGIDVTAPLPGTVISIDFKSGGTVIKGQPLLSLDVGVPEAEYKGLVATSTLRKIQLERATKLFADKQISVSELDNAVAENNAAAAAAAAQKAYIDRKTVYAPFDGELGIRLIDLGSYLTPGDPIVSLQMLDPINIDYSLPEKHLQDVKVGQQLELSVSAYPERIFLAQITTIEPNIDLDTRTLKIRASLRNPQKLLKPGMFVESWTVRKDKKAVLKLPRTAVTYSSFGEVVFVVTSKGDDTIVERRSVTTGEIRGDEIELVSGVAEQDLVVVIGQNKLRNGMKVMVTETLSTSGTD